VTHTIRSPRQDCLDHPCRQRPIGQASSQHPENLRSHHPRRSSRQRESSHRNVTVTNSTNAWAIYLGPKPVAHPSASTNHFPHRTSPGQQPARSLYRVAASFEPRHVRSRRDNRSRVRCAPATTTANASGLKYVPLTPATLLDTRTRSRTHRQADCQYATKPSPPVATPASRPAPRHHRVVSVVNQTSAWAWASDR